MVLVSILTLAGLGLVASLLLALASRVFRVEEDPKVAAVLEVLPNANCGGCGFAGCAGYAAAVVHKPEIPANRCCAGSAETHIAVGKLTGKAITEAEPLFSLRRCDKANGHADIRFIYQGMPSCAGAAQLRGGALACDYACLGYGDCVQVCPFECIEIRNGMAQVNRTRCTGCGNCVAVCPRGVLNLVPKRFRVAVYCSNADKGRLAREVCSVSCLKCQKCVKLCPAQAVKMVNGRIEIDHGLCLEHENCGEVCVKNCSRLILRYSAFGDTPLPPGVLSWKKAASKTGAKE